MFSDSDKELLKNSYNLSYEEFLLKYSSRKDLNISLIAEQIRCRGFAKKKLPELFKKGFIFTKLALEQASSEVTARYKASLISGKALFECNTGIGSDLFFFAKKFESLNSCEIDPKLHSIVLHNLNSASVDNTSLYNMSCEDFLSNYSGHKFDWIYADPSRRDSTGRVISLKNSKPNIIELFPVFEKRAKNLLLKLSPLYDIKQLLREIPEIYRIEVVSVDGECKEILAFVSFENVPKSGKSAVLLSTKSNKITRVDSDIDCSETKIIPPEYASFHYFYVPDSAVVKSGLVTIVAKDNNLFFINKKSNYMFSNELHPQFPGRYFEIYATYDWQRKSISRILKKEGIKKANIARKDFPLSPEEIQNVLKISPGGDDYLFFTKDSRGKKVVIRARKPYGRSPQGL